MSGDIAVLERARDRAEQRLADVAGDATLCVIGRSGERRPGIQYHEGATFSDVHRRAR